MSAPEIVCPNIVLFGRGIDQNGEASAATIARAEAVADYYHQYPSSIEKIVCSGAYSASMPEAPPQGKREALASRAVLIAAGVRHEIIEVEEISVCTFTNIIEVVRGGYLEGAEISPDRPLGMGMGWGHFVRARPIATQAMNIPTSAVHNISPRHETTASDFVKEVLVGVPLVQWALQGAQPGSIEDTDRARVRFENCVTFRRRILAARARARQSN